MSERHRQKRIAALSYILALPRSIWYNCKLLPFSQARKLPLLISHRTVVNSLSGKVEIHASHLRMGIVKIGFNTYQGSNLRHDRTIVNVRGKMVFNGECSLGLGSAIEVAEEAVLTFGNHACLGPKSLVICHKEVTFGDYCRVAWRCTFMDSDQHDLVNENKQITNQDKPIRMGDKVWVGCNVIATKGVHIASNNTVAAGAVLHGSYDECETVIAGNPAKVVKCGVVRNFDRIANRD